MVMQITLLTFKVLRPFGCFNKMLNLRMSNPAHCAYSQLTKILQAACYLMTKQIEFASLLLLQSFVFEFANVGATLCIF